MILRDDPCHARGRSPISIVDRTIFPAALPKSAARARRRSTCARLVRDRSGRHVDQSGFVKVRRDYRVIALIDRITDESLAVRARGREERSAGLFRIFAFVHTLAFKVHFHAPSELPGSSSCSKATDIRLRSMIERNLARNAARSIARAVLYPRAYTMCVRTCLCVCGGGEREGGVIKYPRVMRRNRISSGIDSDMPIRRYCRRNVISL